MMLAELSLYVCSMWGHGIGREGWHAPRLAGAAVVYCVMMERPDLAYARRLLAGSSLTP
jgi:hypothetical protein